MARKRKYSPFKEIDIDDIDDEDLVPAKNRIDGSLVDEVSGVVKEFPIDNEFDKSRINYSAFDIVVTAGDIVELSRDQRSIGGKTIKAKVLEMYSDQIIPDIDAEVKGSPQDPALKVEIYEEKGSKLVPTGYITGFKLSDVIRSHISLNNLEWEKKGDNEEAD